MAAIDILTTYVNEVISAGDTIAFQYPTDRLACDYVTTGAKLFSRGAMSSLEQGNSTFGVSYGASSISVVYVAGADISAGSKVVLEAPLAELELGNTPIGLIAGDMTLAARHAERAFRSDSSTSVSVLVPGDLPEGFNCVIGRWGSGALTIDPTDGATNQGEVDGASAQYKSLSIFVWKNSDGESAEFTVSEQ